MSEYFILILVTSRDDISIGDNIKYFCDDLQKDVGAKIIGFPSRELTHYISCIRHNSKMTEVINMKTTNIYKIIKIECTCGAEHTSNPSFHLSYCNMEKK